MVLNHDAWPGFRKVFIIVFIAASLYLGAILFSSYSHTGGAEDAHHAGIFDYAKNSCEMCL